MKKIISIMLALVLVLSMGTVALAAEGDGEATTPAKTLEEVQDKPISVPKTYKVNNGTAPGETFTFRFTGVSYKNGDGNVVTGASIPEIGNITTTFSDLTETTTQYATKAINAGDYNLGVYTYEVEEVAPETKTTGVTYSSEKLYLVLTILRDDSSGKHYVAAMHYQNATSEDKSSGFTNEYDSGSLTVTKKIQGNMADMEKKFTFTITFAAPAGTDINSTFASNSENGTWSEDGLTYTIALGHDESVTLSNIPAGTTYTVTEDKENYDSDNGVFSDDAKTISANDADTVTFTNTLTQGIDMGISLDSMPYVLMLVVVAAGLFVLISKKRAAREN